MSFKEEDQERLGILHFILRLLLMELKGRLVYLRSRLSFRQSSRQTSLLENMGVVLMLKEQVLNLSIGKPLDQLRFSILHWITFKLWLMQLPLNKQFLFLLLVRSKGCSWSKVNLHHDPRLAIVLVPNHLETFGHLQDRIQMIQVGRREIGFARSS